MFDTTFNHGLTRRYTTIFGTLFNNIYITRQDEDGVTVQSSKIPLIYGFKDKFIQRTELDPTLERQIAIPLPRISFAMMNMQYASERKIGSTGKLSAADPNEPDKKIYQFVPVPYDLQFTVSIVTKSMSDMTMIVDQIIPYFTPELTLSAELIPALSLKRDIQVVLNSTIIQEQYEGSYEERPTIICDMDFTLLGFYFGPTREAKVIKQIDLNYYPDVDVSIDPIISTFTIPGLTANGTPTSNADLTINKSQISSDDNYGIIKTFEEDV